MSTGAHNDVSGRESRLDEVLGSYLEALAAGRAPGREELLARNPDLADELARFFADQDAVDRWTGPLRSAAQAALTEAVAGAITPPLDEVARSPSESLPTTPHGYELLGEIGRGGMGVVYKARDRRLNRVVALKMLRAGDLSEEDDLRRFRNEAEMVAALDHPHIVPVYEVGEYGRRCFFSMKLVEGGSLTQHLSRYPADPRAAARLVTTVARAVHHAHQRGILHRDLKPDNILLSWEGGPAEASPSLERCTPHVSDFGLAKRVEVDSSLTQSGCLVGTPGYMAPEQTTGVKGAVTTATDVYGLGAILYALLTGKPPFQGETVLDTLEQVRQREPEPPGRVNPKVDRDLEPICLKCLDKDPQRRYESAALLADDLDRWLRGEPIQARRPTLAQRLRKWGRRHQAAVTAAAVCLLVSLVALAGSVGWVLGERWGRQREAEGKVREALEAAGPGLRQGNPHDPALIVAVQGAEAQLRTGAVRPELRGRVEQLRRDQEMLSRLEKARLQGAAGGNETDFDPAGADQLYAAAFDWYGLHVTTLGPDEAAQRVRASAIGTHLVAGLDNWASARDMLLPDSGAALWAVAHRADDDPWRLRVRRATARPDRRALDGLAAEDGVLSQPPANLILLARGLRNVRSWATAERLLRAAQLRHPADFWINFELAGVLEHKSPADPAERVRFYQAALALRPQSSAVYNNLSLAFLDQGRLDDALAAIREALRLAPDSANDHNTLGNVLVEKGQLDGAIDAYGKAIRLRPDFALPHNGLGNALCRKGRLDDAIEAYREAIRLKPDDVFGHNGLGNALCRKGRLDDAIRAYRKAIDLKPDAWFVHDGLGHALGAKGQLDEAIAAFRQAIRADPHRGEPHFNLGISLNMKGRVGEAIDAFRKAAELQPNSALAHHFLGTALSAKGQLNEALAAHRKAVSLSPNNPLVYNNVAAFLLECSDPKLRDPVEAVRLAKRAVELRPQQGEFWQLLGVAHYRAGEWPAAVAALNKSMELRKGGDGEDWFYLAMAHWRLGEKDQARTWYERASGWMGKNKRQDGGVRASPTVPGQFESMPNAEPLRRLQAEAAELLGVKDGPASNKEVPPRKK